MKILQAAFVVVFASAALWQPPLLSAAEKKEPVIIGHDKMLVAWVTLADLKQRGGGVLAIQHGLKDFDAVVFAELNKGKWMAGSKNHLRTQENQASCALETAGPDTLDWDLWLGPAPYRPYNPAYLPFVWRGWWDFGTGALGDMGCHSFDPIFRALKLGYPTSVEATSTLVNKETFPVASIVHYEFPARGNMPPVKLTWYDGGLKPRRPDELEEGRKLRPEGILFVGDKGKLLNERLIPESRMKHYGKPPQVLPRSPGHFKEWFNACKGGEPAGSNFDFAGPLTEVVLLGNVALRPELKQNLTQTKLYWDGQNMQFTNVPEANEFLHREYREGWTL